MCEHLVHVFHEDLHYSDVINEHQQLNPYMGPDENYKILVLERKVILHNLKSVCQY